MISIPALTNLAVDILIQVRVRAKNPNGFGEYSEKNTVGQVVHTIPQQMPPVTYVFNEITNTQIVVHWLALTGTNAGGTAVTVDNYKLEVESSTAGTWTVLTTTTNLQYTHGSLTGGQSYKYRVIAINEYGDGAAYSTSVVIKAAQPPAAPAAPVITLSSIYVKVAWTEPNFNHAPITSYQVKIETKAGTFVENTGLCNGADQTTLQNKFCLVPMTKLWIEPFLRTQGDLVKAKMIAINERGPSTESPANASGINIEVKPQQMVMPT